MIPYRKIRVATTSFFYLRDLDSNIRKDDNSIHQSLLSFRWYLRMGRKADEDSRKMELGGLRLEGGVGR